MKREVERIIAPIPSHFVGDGFKVHNFIPSTTNQHGNRMDPFILLDYNAPTYFPPTDKPRGVGVHPHRGFETVTIAYKGKVEHHDSSGGGGVIKEGDVQWMTAASGVLHKEFHETEFAKEGGDFQMVQLWVNLPAADKMSEPKYQAVENKDMTRLKLENGSGEMELIAGNYNGKVGPASTFTPMLLANLKLNENASTMLDLPAINNTALLVVEGSIKVNGAVADVNQFVLMENKGSKFTVESESGAKVLVLSGEPINEPMASHGPFVMNTQMEIIEAINDFNSGKFGTLD